MLLLFFFCVYVCEVYTKLFYILIHFNWIGWMVCLNCIVLTNLTKIFTCRKCIYTINFVWHVLLVVHHRYLGCWNVATWPVHKMNNLNKTGKKGWLLSTLWGNDNHIGLSDWFQLSLSYIREGGTANKLNIQIAPSILTQCIQLKYSRRFKLTKIERIQ